MTDVAEYVANFVSDGDRMFDALWTELNWEKREDAPRREYWTNIFNRPYTYGRGAGIRTYAPQETHWAIEAVADLLEARNGWRYEACFLNGYETNRDWLGWHSDDDPAIDHGRGIAVVTLGGARKIEYQLISDLLAKDHTNRVGKLLEHGSLFEMKPGMQDTHYHRIPKADHVVTKPRISLTFRGLYV